MKWYNYIDWKPVDGFIYENRQSGKVWKPAFVSTTPSGFWATDDENEYAVWTHHKENQ